ncbi:hypothetical protein F5148DRAFT_1227681 [Russula earlei]|uniref:Uncharacterized protein n=1 Tax=Russula earlei TaxID=71964 RepID=A0ACC0U0G8_9AGAM|nr:hypothetical protein F5148DRAFT_1227681 [Russula earlei]
MTYARWNKLWDGLRVEGEMNAGSEETERVWRTRLCTISIVSTSRKKDPPLETETVLHSCNDVTGTSDGRPRGRYDRDGLCTHTQETQLEYELHRTPSCARAIVKYHADSVGNREGHAFGPVPVR